MNVTTNYPYPEAGNTPSQISGRPTEAGPATCPTCRHPRVVHIGTYCPGIDCYCAPTSGKGDEPRD